MNAVRVAALLRELADAIDEQPKPVQRPKRLRSRRIAPTPQNPPSQDMIEKVRRTLRKQGVCA